MTADRVTYCDVCGEPVAPGAEVFTPPETPDDLDDLDRSGVLCRECADTVAELTVALGGTASIHPLGEGPLMDDDTTPEPLDDTTDEPERLAADAPPGDTYGREQAARVLGVSARRVSQLAADGRLEVVQDKPLRLSAESVHKLRAERRGPGRDQRATVPPADAGANVAEQIERVVGLVVAEHRKAIEAGEHLLAEVTAQRDEYRAEVERLRTEVESERAARAAAEHSRRWWQRG